MHAIEKNSETPILFQGFLIVFAIGIANGFYLAPLSKYSAALFWAQDIIHFVVIPAIILIYVNKRFRVKPSDYGLISPSPSYPLLELIGASVFIAIIFGLILLPFDTLLYQLLYSLDLTDPGLKYASTIPEGVLRFAVVFYLAITAGVAEEIFYRGIPYKLVFESQSIVEKKLVYVLGTSIAFSAIHWDKGLHFIIGTFVFGLFAAFLYLKLKNLWPLIGGHFIYDFYIFW